MIGFIIQGPLLTFGQGPNNSSLGYETTESISANIQKIDSLGFKYIVVTWVPQQSKEKEILKKLLQQNINIKVIESPTLIDPDHRYKHHYGIAEGLKELDKDINFIVKIRTDQIYQKEFFDFIEYLYISNCDKLCVSELYNEPFFIGDFIYAAKKTIFTNFINGFLSFQTFKFHPCLAMDIGMKYCHTTKFRTFGKYFPTFFYFIFRANYIRILWNNFIYKHIIVIPAHVRDNILWRNKKIGDIVDSSYFKFNSEPIVQNFPFWPRLYSYILHWKIYLFKRYSKQLMPIKAVKYSLKKVYNRL